MSAAAPNERVSAAASDERLIAAFLDMASAERGAAGLAAEQGRIPVAQEENSAAMPLRRLVQDGVGDASMILAWCRWREDREL